MHGAQIIKKMMGDDSYNIKHEYTYITIGEEIITTKELLLSNLLVSYFV